MNEAVLDASVILKWFVSDESGKEAAMQLRSAFEAGELSVFIPPLLHLEVVNTAARRWHWKRQALVELAHAVQQLPFRLRHPSLAAVAAWCARGLTAYDASYVALAETEEMRLITDDRLILSIATRIAVPLVA